MFHDGFVYYVGYGLDQKKKQFSKKTHNLAKQKQFWLSTLAIKKNQACPAATVTSCTVAFNRLAPLHVDPNLGPSHLTAVGRFAGGELWLADTDPSGRAEPLQNRWLTFLASVPHRTLPFTGCRGYVTFYVDRAAPRADAATYAALSQLGVPLPTSSTLLAWQGEARDVGPPKVRLATARAKWRLFAAGRSSGLSRALRVASGTWVCRGCRKWGRWTSRPRAWCSTTCRRHQARALPHSQHAKRQTPT